jgi:hypothetical protein
MLPSILQQGLYFGGTTYKLDNIMFAPQAEGINTNHVNLRLLDVILSVYVLNLVTVPCYTREEIDNFLHISGNENAHIWVPLPYHKDCK